MRAVTARANHSCQARIPACAGMTYEMARLPTGRKALPFRRIRYHTRLLENPLRRRPLAIPIRMDRITYQVAFLCLNSVRNLVLEPPVVLVSVPQDVWSRKDSG